MDCCCEALTAEINRLKDIISIMDEYTPKADDTCAEPGITFSEAVMRQFPRLKEEMRRG